jgi:hypothetical protein
MRGKVGHHPSIQAQKGRGGELVLVAHRWNGEAMGCVGVDERGLIPHNKKH